MTFPSLFSLFRSLRWVQLAAVLLSLSFTLQGCAAPQAFALGEAQLLERKWESAIESFAQASQADPGNVEYRTALVRATDKAVNELLVEAASLREKQPEQANAVYRRILALSPNNQRAAEGLRAIEAVQRHQRLFEEASRAASNGREQEARAKFKKLLSEMPSFTAARQALQAMDEKSGRAGDQRPVLDPALRKPVSLEFRDATLKMLFDALASSTGINFVFDRDLKQDSRVTIFLRKVSFDEALEQILSSNGLARKVVNTNTLLIYSAQPQKAKEYQDLTVRNFFVANADVKQLTSLLKTVLKVKDIFTDEKRNLIVIRDTPELVAMAEKMVAAHDQPEPEVMLEVEILEFNHTKDNNLGIKFPDQVSFGIANPLTLSALRSLSRDKVTVSGLDTVLAINLRRQLGDINLLANPRIRVRNREKARFHIGDKVPVITSTTFPGSLTGATSSQVSYLDVGIRLEFEPSIQLDNDVVIKTSLEVSSITNTVQNAGTTAYQVGTRNAATTLTLRDGETQVLAGLLSTDETKTSSRLPGLGDIPVVGQLFNSNATKGGRKEILLSITPRILRNLQRPTDDLMEINFGPETGNQGPSGQIAAASSQPQQPAPVIAIPQTRSQSGTVDSTPSILVPMVPFGLSTTQPQATTPTANSNINTNTGTAVDPQGKQPTPGTTFELPPGVGSSNR